MVDQLPNLGREAEMLSAMGYTSMDDLFSDVPVDVRMQEDLPLRPSQTEEEIIADARRLLGANVPLRKHGLLHRRGALPKPRARSGLPAGHAWRVP